MVPKICITILLKDLMKCYLNLVLVTSFLTKQENGNARHDASQKTIKNSTLLHSIGILANQAKATKRTTAACKIQYVCNYPGQEEGVSRKSTPVHMTKDKMSSIVYPRGGWGLNWVKFGTHSCWMPLIWNDCAFFNEKKPDGFNVLLEYESSFENDFQVEKQMTSPIIPILN